MGWLVSRHKGAGRRPTSRAEARGSREHEGGFLKPGLCVSIHVIGMRGRRASQRGLRHAFGVGTLAAGVPLNIVQRLLGHSSITTTTIYTEAAGPEQYALAEKFWTLNG